MLELVEAARDAHLADLDADEGLTALCVPWHEVVAKAVVVLDRPPRDLRALRRTAVTATSGLRPLPVTRSALTVAAYMQRRRRKRRRCSAAPARSANSGINHLW